MCLRHFASAFVLGSVSLVLSGCAGLRAAAPAAPTTVALSGLHGNVMGGRSPISGALIQIYQAGTTGYGAGATGLIPGGGALTLPNGTFSLTGAYTCAAGSEVYLVSTGGDPGSGSANAAAYLMAGLGLCDNLNANTFISINEVTTVATAYALQSFSTGINVGAPITNQTGLVNAFADINTLVNVATGFAQSNTASTSIPQAELYTLANILAGCVNTTGAAQPGCSQLFTDATPPGGAAPSNTVEAILNIARYPGNNVDALLALSAPTAPYAPTLTSASDFTVGVTYKGCGMSGSSAVAIDASGNVWIANATANTVTALTHTGAPLSGATGFGTGILSAPSALAFDSTGYLWVANAGNSTITKLSSSGSAVGIFTGGGLSTPTSIAFDTLGKAWLTNSGNNSVSEFASSGTALSPAGTGYQVSGVSAPVGVAIDPR